MAFEHIPHSFFDELEKIALDPVTMAGTLAMGKIMATNAISRHAMKIAPIRRIGQEVAGVGFRTGMKGKPLLGKVTREAAAIGVDPKMTSLYEHAHQAGSALRGMPAQAAPVFQRQMMQHPLAQQFPQAQQFFRGVPTTPGAGIPGAIRRTVDYGFTPVRQVGSDINRMAGRAFSGLRARFSPRPASVT